MYMLSLNMHFCNTMICSVYFEKVLYPDNILDTSERSQLIPTSFIMYASLIYHTVSTDYRSFRIRLTGI